MASEKITALVEQVKELTVLELSELVHTRKRFSAFLPLLLLLLLPLLAVLLRLLRRRPSLMLS